MDSCHLGCIKFSIPTLIKCRPVAVSAILSSESKNINVYYMPTNNCALLGADSSHIAQNILQCVGAPVDCREH